VRILIFLAALLAAMAPTEASAFGTCTDPSYMTAFDHRLSPGPCDPVTTVDIRWHGNVAHLRVIKMHSSALTGDPALVARVDEAAARVGSAMEQMGNVTIGEVTLLLTDFVSPAVPDDGFDKGDIDAWATDHHGECPVTLFQTHRGLSGDAFVFIIAHELFHCIQYKTWHHLPRQDWITEGTAEYFAQLARPGLRLDDNYTTEFDRRIPNTALSALDYPAVVYFAWLGQSRGPTAVTALLQAASSRVNIEELIPADTWMEFAQAYFDRAIQLPGGQPLRSSPQPGATITIHGTDHFAFPAVPYALHNATLVFERGHLFNVSYLNQPADSRTRWRKAAGGAWGPALTTVSTCDGEQRYRVVWITTHSTTAGEMRVAVQPGGATACACPVGAWTETVESLKRLERRLPAFGLGGNNTRYVSGSRSLVLNPDHTGSFTYNALTVRVRSSAESWLDQVQTGVVLFEWSTDSGQLLTYVTRGTNLITLHNTSHIMHHVHSEERRVGAQSIGHNFVCNETGLHLTTPVGGGLYDMDFTGVIVATEPPG
jgi:hypothetical protein